MMVTLSMGVLQCNLLANVSTVAGEPHFNFLCSLSLSLWPWGLQDSSSSVAHLLGNGQTSDNPGEETRLFAATQIWGHSQY